MLVGSCDIDIVHAELQSLDIDIVRAELHFFFKRVKIKINQ